MGLSEALPAELETTERHEGFVVTKLGSLLDWAQECRAVRPVTPSEPDRRAGIFAVELDDADGAARALEAAGTDPEEIDLFVMGTTTPDLVFPSTACLLQKKLGLPDCGAMDVNAACSGFLYALSVADKFIKTGDARKVLVAGAETLSEMINQAKRPVCPSQTVAVPWDW